MSHELHENKITTICDSIFDLVRIFTPSTSFHVFPSFLFPFNEKIPQQHFFCYDIENVWGIGIPWEVEKPFKVSNTFRGYGYKQGGVLRAFLRLKLYFSIYNTVKNENHPAADRSKTLHKLVLQALRRHFTSKHVGHGDAISHAVTLNVAISRSKHLTTSHIAETKLP